MLNDKLSAIQVSLKAPKKQYNDFSKYHYRSCEDILNAVKPYLLEHGISLRISDRIVYHGQRYYIEATAILSDGTETISVTGFAREAETRKGMDDSQITGSASSYARKYALNGLFCIDDTRDADTQDNADKSNIKQDIDGKYHKISESITKHAELNDASSVLDLWLDLTDDDKKIVWNLLPASVKEFIKNNR